MVPLFERMSLRPGYLFRPPDWRWRAAIQWRDDAPKGRLPEAALDPGVRTAIGIQDVLQSGGNTDAVLAAVLDQTGAAAEAYKFWSEGGVAVETPSGDPAGRTVTPGTLSAKALARNMLEALILAKKAPARIMKLAPLSAEAVTWYESLFFDVRDRLSYRGWVAVDVIGSLHEGTIHTLMPALFRAYGYYTKSAAVISELYSTFNAAAAKIAKTDPQAFFSADYIATAAFKASLVSHLLVVHADTYKQILEFHRDAVEVDVKRRGASGGTNEERFKELAGNMLGVLGGKTTYREAPTDLAATRIPQLPALRLASGADLS